MLHWILFSEKESSEEVSVKKLKVTSDICEKYEARVSRISCWADHILTRLDEGLERLDLVDQQLLYEETEAEVRSQEEKTKELLEEGRNLSCGEFNSSCYFCRGLHTCQLLSLYKHSQRLTSEVHNLFLCRVFVVFIWLRL